jgi:anhydro-N-acetylmuramic acid kinase
VTQLYIGLMSGTSLDGVDGVLVDLSCMPPKVWGNASTSLPDDLRQELLALNTSGADELHRAALAANALVRVYASVVHSLLLQTGVSAHQVRAVGAHGQTVRHRPQEFDGTGYTLQLNQPALLAELCGIDVVADFRSRDVAAGGQGAPLVPPFHRAMFTPPQHDAAVLNLGGIANVTLLPASTDQPLIGFDCGPANALMDVWCQRHTGHSYDKDGQWAASGTVQPTLLRRMQQEPFFALPAPKSTGRDLFHATWLEKQLQGLGALAAHDVQATLAELTAWACADSVQRHLPHCQALIVCGGGAYNTHLMSRLQMALAPCKVQASDLHGLPAQQVEAAAFAWLAQQTVLRQTGSIQSVTGARGARILGAVYPAY